jgi:PAS domain S-box-containing protein
MSTAVAAAVQPRILVVDDEVGPRESIRMLLKRLYQVKTAESGRVALADIPKFHPDLVVLDIKMAEMNGLEVLRRIKQLDPTIEVVMITAYASLETVKLALTHGAFEYLIKPFSRQDLEDVVRRALSRRQADLGRQGQVVKLVDEMRGLAAKTRELEETARREAAEVSLRVAQLSLLREISRTIVTELDAAQLSMAITEQLRSALGYDSVRIVAEAPPEQAGASTLSVCEIRDAGGSLGWLVVDNRQSGHPIDPREAELLDMLAEYLAIALRNARLYGEITETKRSLEQLIASAGDGIIALDTADRIHGWNPAAERIFELAGSEASGRPVTEMMLPSDYADARRRLAAGAPMHTFETKGTTGRATALAVTLSALGGRDGTLSGLIAIVRDITLQREMESQLQQSEKLTALGQLAGGIAHDFNNLLQAILGYAQLMKANVDNRQLLQRSLAIVESAAVDGSETVRRIQQFARLRPDEAFVPVDITQVARDAVAITQPRLDERRSRDGRPLEIQLDLHPVPGMSGRPAALTEMMTNLVLNAFDAMPDGGVLKIATRSGQARTIVLTVADNGVGMPDDVKQRIFEPFFSTKGEAGSGLGLAMVYSIVKRHGGEIRVDSELHRGTTFTITFPAASERRTPEGQPAPTIERRTARVLVVDDEGHVLSALGAMLESAGHTVTTTETPIAALSAFAPGRFDVVLTNIGLVGMSGWELARRIRAEDAHVPILFITGWGLREEDKVRLEALNIQRCLFKPVRPDELDAAVQGALPSA